MSYIHMFLENVRGENKGFDLLHLRDDGAMYAECVNTWKENCRKRKTLLKITCIWRAVSLNPTD